MIEVTSQGLINFLNQLGKCYRHPGRLYLIGGSSLLLVEAKTVTFDVDVKIEIPNEYHDLFIRCLREVSRKNQIPVEQASPDQFIPLPKGYQDRHQFIGRYGDLDVFHFDFYSIALSKLHRGNEKDYADVVQMITQDLIAFSNLKAKFEEILPKLETFDIRSNPENFVRNFNLLEKRLDEN